MEAPALVIEGTPLRFTSTAAPNVTEHVLPSGIFAALRKPQWGDLLDASDVNYNMGSMKLMTKIVTLDDQPATMASLRALLADDYYALQHLLNVVVSTCSLGQPL